MQYDSPTLGITFRATKIVFVSCRSQLRFIEVSIVQVPTFNANNADPFDCGFLNRIE